MEHDAITEAFVKLGVFLKHYVQSKSGEPKNKVPENPWAARFDQAVSRAGQENGWFTEEQVRFAFGQWSRELTAEKLLGWRSSYTLAVGEPKTIAIVMAGNIPLVGLHDLLSVLLTGNKVLVKLSNNDKVLLPLFTSFLEQQNEALVGRVTFTQEKLSHFHAVIATGSNNTARYFEYYFKDKPHLIRKNRNSVAVLTGTETPEELQALGEDIFRYYGLGCRSVSKLFVPKGYDFEPFFKAMFGHRDIIHHHKYANNYDYNKAVYLMSGFKILDNGFLVLKEETAHASPIAALFYETYASRDALRKRLDEDSALLQCVVGHAPTDKPVAFGRTQWPALTDYADGVDTVQFLLNGLA
ncbi:acyl-CoA reductase [Maribacter sp. 2307ULW6-5]|uniref:acyl-CoA reductase n=1 Tax=Maribacter sp. 2307ULW6-5 TaxID=3386275 RepID=UPI0039BD4BA3